MRRIICLAFGIFLILCESSFFSFLPIELAKPDLARAIHYLRGLLSLARRRPACRGGLRIHPGDTVKRPFGRHAFHQYRSASFLHLRESRLYIESRYIFSLVCAASVLFESLLFLALSLLSKGETKDIFNVLLYSVPDAIVTAFVALFMFGFLERFRTGYWSGA